MDRADRRYLWFTVWLFVLLGLVGLGAMLYRPLRLAYIVYRVRHTTWNDLHKSQDFPDYINEVDECTKEACKGNRLAMEAVVDVSGFGDASVAEMTYDIAYRVVAKQPEAFFEALSRRPAARQIKVLADIANSCLTEELAEGFFGIEFSTPADLAKELEKLAKARNPEVRRVAQAALEFTRRRFARELAEAERVKKAKTPRERRP